jgi:CBS-domain-containing membrane protein
MTDIASPPVSDTLRRWLAGSARPTWVWVLCSGIGGFIAVLLLSLTAEWLDVILLVPPFGASCVLAFGLPDSPLAQPRNIIGGHVISAFVGIACLMVFGSAGWSIALAVGLAIMAMQLTRTVHPPAGANPILVMLAGAGWLYIIAPILMGSIGIVAVAFVYNNLIPGRGYPKH